jgi:hypothetical protein
MARAETARVQAFTSVSLESFVGRLGSGAGWLNTAAESLLSFKQLLTQAKSGEKVEVSMASI